MGRPARIDFAGAVHHATARTPSGRLLFLDDHDRQRYLQLLAREARERAWDVFTYCLMPNHVHVLVRTAVPDLSAGFKRAHERYARELNRRHGLHGHVFGARFANKLVATDRHFLGCLRYIARNPVAAMLCSRAHDWPWSAHRALAGLEPPPSFVDLESVYALVADEPLAARSAYVQLVDQSDTELVTAWRAAGSDSWMPAAVDEFSITVPRVAAALGVATSSVYRRLAAARETQVPGT